MGDWVFRLVRELVERPADGIFGEEYGATGDLARQWIIDPIDGTAGFIKHEDDFAIQIGLTDNGHVGAMGFYNLGIGFADFLDIINNNGS